MAAFGKGHRVTAVHLHWQQRSVQKQQRWRKRLTGLHERQVAEFPQIEENERGTPDDVFARRAVWLSASFAQDLPMTTFFKSGTMETKTVSTFVPGGQGLVKTARLSSHW